MLLTLCDQMDPTIFFLDFGGVFHPGAACLAQGGPMLQDDGELLIWAPLLDDMTVPATISTSAD